MPIYEITKDAIVPISKATFAAQGLHERKDVQRLLRESIGIVSPDTMVLAEEFGDWVESSRRIDLLGLHRDGSLVVVELKRTEDGGHMELQSIRYAAMVSPMTFEQAVEAHRKYLAAKGSTDDAQESILSFLGTDEPSEFNASVRIVLASADFSKEITSSVLWLNDQGLDITCVRLRPYKYGEKTLLDIQQVIPLPEAEEFQIAIQQQSSERRAAAKRTGRDFTKYWLRTKAREFERLNKRNFIFEVVKEAIRLGKTPEEVAKAIPWRSVGRLFLAHPGNLDSVRFIEASDMESVPRYFCDEGDLFFSGGKTHAFTNQWGIRTEEAVRSILATLPSDHGIEFRIAS